MSLKKIREIKSYVQRSGRLTKSQSTAIKNHWENYGVELSQSAGFMETLPTDKPIVLDIGFGDGAALIDAAIQNPDRNYYGVEVHKPGIGRALSAIHSNGIKNLRLFQVDVKEVLRVAFPDGSIDLVQIFFPDPWHKKRHHKRRLIQLPFLSLLHNKMKAGGELHIATDWEPYADFINEEVDASALYRNVVSEGGVLDADVVSERRSCTKFEQRGLRKGHLVKDLLFEKI